MDVSKDLVHVSEEKVEPTKRPVRTKTPSLKGLVSFGRHEHDRSATDGHNALTINKRGELEVSGHVTQPLDAASEAANNIEDGTQTKPPR